MIALISSLALPVDPRRRPVWPAVVIVALAGFCVFVTAVGASVRADGVAMRTPAERAAVAVGQRVAGPSASRTTAGNEVILYGLLGAGATAVVALCVAALMGGRPAGVGVAVAGVGIVVCFAVGIANYR